MITLNWFYLNDETAYENLDFKKIRAGWFLKLPKTIDFSVDYLRAGLPEDAYARAHIIRSGRRYASVHVEGWQNSKEKLFAYATGHFVLPQATFGMTQLKLNVTSASLTHRRVLKIALPIVLSNATVPILGAVDVGVVGQLGAAAPIGAVGLGAIILTTIFWMFGFLRMGTVGLVGQAAGSGCDDQATEWLTRALLVAAAGGISIIIMQWPVFWLAFQLVTASKEVETLARNYVSIPGLGSTCCHSDLCFDRLVDCNGANGRCVLDSTDYESTEYFFGFFICSWMGWGVPGVAIATVIAEVSGAALALWLCRNAFLGPAWRNWASIFNRHKLTKMTVITP